MKILYSHRTRSADGQYVHIRELTEALRARGHNVVMAGPGGAEEGVHRALDAKSSGSLMSMLPGALYEFAELAYSAPAYWRLRRLFQEIKPDIFYQRYNLFYYPGAWLRRANRVPFILEVNAPLVEERTRHGGLALKRLAENSERKIWRTADMVLPVTNVLADCIRAAGVPDERIKVIQNGVSAAFLESPNPELIRKQYGLQEKIVLGFTGFVREWHGVDRAIRFLAAQNRSDLHLLVVGDGPARSNLESLAANLGVADQLTITGVIQRDELPAYVAAFNIALQPAAVDYASPLKLFEYMALGKAIVAPASANIRETLKDGEDALLFSQEDDNAFDKALAALVNDRELRVRLGGAVRASLLRQDLTWAGNARRIETIAQRLISETA